MNKVVAINLGGRAYQLEEAGYDLLRTYLDDAARALGDDPGKNEIIEDLEQAIAEKCDRLLAPHKSVVTAADVERIVQEMGPVEGEHTDTSRESGSQPHALKRLYLMREGAVIAGVCAGIAAYLRVEVTIVRIVFIAATVFTGGLAAVLYIALALLIPYADTAQARAEARGEPLNAETLVQRAKDRFGETYERVTGAKFDWDNVQHLHDEHRQWRENRHAWKNAWREERRAWKHAWREEHHAWKYGYPHRPIVDFLLTFLSLAWLASLITLITVHSILWWSIPSSVPLWLAVIVLFFGYFAVTGPLKSARYGDRHDYGCYHYSAWDGIAGSLMILFVIIACIWAYFSVPEFYFLVYHPVAAAEQLVSYLQTWLATLH